MTTAPLVTFLRGKAMRSLIALSCVNGVPVVAKAQQPPTPTVDEMQAQCLVETGQLRVALGQAQAQIIQLRKENADLKAKGEQKPEVKK